MSEYGHRLEFNSEGLAVCPESGEKYRLRTRHGYKNRIMK